MRIGIASRSRLRATALRRAVAGISGHAIAWTAPNGGETLRLCLTRRPDLLLLDLEIPGIDGVEVTRRVMETSPCAIVIVSPSRPDALEPQDVSRVYDAMGFGALDVVAAPFVNPRGEVAGAAALEEKIRTVERLIGDTPPPSTEAAALGEAAFLVALGASTGGPQAIANVLGRLPRDLSAALLIVQHIEAAYAPGLASWLHEKTGFPVEFAESGAPPRRGVALLLAGLEDDAVDLFFGSLAGHVPPGVAVLLTGMGRDGAAGLLELRRLGWNTICQDERTSIVYGMPKAAVEIGAAALVLPLEAIGPTIAAAVSRVTPS